MDIGNLTFQQGFAEEIRTGAAILYNQAFGQKFSVAIGSEEKRISILEASFVPNYAFVALNGNRIVGLAGFHTMDGSLNGEMSYRGLISNLGIIKGNWAALIFSLFEREPEPGELLMDGIAVHAEFRGQGIGTMLLDKIAEYSQDNGYKQIRLDVIDTNPRARNLYERKGFKAVKSENFPYLRWLLGFGGSTTMILQS